MIGFDELLARLRGLERRELVRWVENRWVLPEQHGETWVFHEVDVARVELIVEIRRDYAIDDEAMPVVLDLLDRLYATRVQLRGILQMIAELPEAARGAVILRLEGEARS